MSELLREVKKFNITYSIDNRSLNTPTEINQVRYANRGIVAGKKEEEYANNQATQWKEIAAYMDLIASRKTRISHDDIEISVPRSEAPAYLEWSLWRAFLAIDTLVNTPNKVRRFKVDQDFSLSVQLQ